MNRHAIQPHDTRRRTTANTVAMLALPVLLLAGAFSPACGGQPAGPARTAPDNAQSLDKSIERTISRPEYRWRLPREKLAPEATVAQHGTFWETLDRLILRHLEDIRDTLREIAKWIEKHLTMRPVDPNAAPSEITWRAGVIILMEILLALVVCVLLIMLYRLWRRRTRSPAPVRAQAVASVPDLVDETVSPDKYASDEWMALAHDLIAKGEYRLAIRAMFLACLTNLARRERITIRRHKSNREYMRELERKAHDDASLIEAFAGNISIIEKVWYGQHPASRETFEDFSMNQEKIYREPQTA
ncbi:MAG: hypothetical protein C0404_12490 [Verrucomicrobia bacterium]|nr:hypothetical protein [Verrucomicrobiota bacterium]